jgi:hypothetical protein
MNKDTKDFIRYSCLVISTWALTQTLDYYLQLDFTGKYSWIILIVMAFSFFLLSK